MDSAGPVLLIVAVLAVVVVAIVFGAKQAQKRRDALAALARRLGWRFDPDRDRHHDERFAQFAMFRQGHGRAAYNTLEGEITIADRVYRGQMGDFTYKVTRNNGKSRTTTTYHVSYLLLRPPLVWRGELRIRPEHLFDKLAGAIGFDDIDFESEEFSRKFHVKCDDKRFAYDVVTPRMMEFLLRSSPQLVEYDDGWCLLSQGNKRWRPEEFETHLGWLGTFFEHWPEHLMKDMAEPQQGLAASLGR